MISETTINQIAGLQLRANRPLVICDVDEVVVHFTRDFEDYLAGQDLELDTSRMLFSSNIRQRRNLATLSPEDSERAVVQFFAERTLAMKTIDGAVEALLNIEKSADVVMLTNLPHEAGDDRRANLAGHGLNFPVVTNSGPKGPAIRKIAAQIEAPVVFIDDSPGFITSAFEHAPDVHLIHFLHDERYARLVTSM
ncbi:MAG TPA: hypothetical protein PLL12_13840, partial [Aestuariivirga sp.]|nr:hypothetical protein [Aestuariivirga sp.]